MLSCKEATHLMSQAHDRRLELGERIALRIHLAICGGCSNFRRQIDFLGEACRRYAGRGRRRD